MSHQINLPENLTIHHINSQFSELKQTITSSEGTVVFDAGAVDSIDTAGLQMLLVFIRNLESRNINFSWQNASEQLIDSAKNLNLTLELKL